MPYFVRAGVLLAVATVWVCALLGLLLLGTGVALGFGLETMASLRKARIALGRRRVIFFRGRTEQFGEDGLQRIGPNLVALERGM